jgi:hypothetical protein
VIARVVRWQDERSVAADIALAALIVAFAVPNELAESTQRLGGLA